MIRPQYHFRQGPRGLRAWNVARLIRLADELPVENWAVADIPGLDEPYWGDKALTVRNVAEHARLISDADLSYPILLCAEGRVMDGMHRVARALADGIAAVPVKRFEVTPEPDHENADPELLSYDPAEFQIRT